LDVQELDGVLGLLHPREEALGEAHGPWSLGEYRRGELVGVPDKNNLQRRQHEPHVQDNDKRRE
jgi:hypothetical protein